MNELKKTSALTKALIISAIVHAIIIFVHFKNNPPQWTQQWRNETEIAVILNTDPNHQKPQETQQIAQWNAQGGGDLEEKNKESSSPVNNDEQEVVLQEAQQQGTQEELRNMELEIQRMMLSLKNQHKVHPQGENKKGHQNQQESMNMALKLAAKIEKDYQEYASRPKKTFIGATAKESSMAQWIAQWQRKIEKMGNDFYPQEARGKVRGNLIVTVSIKKTGELNSIQIDRSSGHKILDQATKKIVEMAAPFEPFSSEMIKSTDILYITRKWTYGDGGIESIKGVILASPSK